MLILRRVGLLELSHTQDKVEIRIFMVELVRAYK